MNCNCPRSSYGIKHTSECYDALAAELTDASHELVTSVAALATAMARAKALEADRDQISLTLDVAKADRDKWFNRARVLEAALRKISAKGREHPDPYVPGSWFADVADTALGSSVETACEHDWQEVDVYPFKGWKCAKCPATKT